MTVMAKADHDEAIAFTNIILKALQATIFGLSGTQGAKTNFKCGQLIVNGAAELYAGGTSFWIAFQNCFEAAQQSGTTFSGMDSVRGTATALVPGGVVATAVKNFAIRMALAEQARILAATVFTSRQQIDEYFDLIDIAFGEAELVAADNKDNVAYTALVGIHAAVSTDLATRSFTLPSIVAYTFPSRMPSLWLAHRIYTDASRNDELIAQNRPIHPLFMPAVGTALSG